MKVKICGIKFENNLEEILRLQPDFVGFILYDPSPRGVSLSRLESLRAIVGKKSEPILVTVNYPVTELCQICHALDIRMVQLHGDEDIRYLQKVKQKGIQIIKSVSIEDHLPSKYLEKLRKSVDYFLFDTRGTYKGGNGIPFSHEILKEYSLSVPYFLSGGLTPEIVQDVLAQPFANLAAVDVNSRFEIVPGWKDVGMLKRLMQIVGKNQEGMYHEV